MALLPNQINEGTTVLLPEFNNRLAAIVESSEDAIIGKTLDGIVTSWNQSAERMYGFSAKEMIGTSVNKIAPKDQPDEIPEILKKLVAESM